MIDDAAFRLKIRTGSFRPRRRNPGAPLRFLLARLPVTQQRLLHVLIVALVVVVSTAA